MSSQSSPNMFQSRLCSVHHRRLLSPALSTHGGVVPSMTALPQRLRVPARPRRGGGYAVAQVVSIAPNPDNIKSRIFTEHH